MDFKFIIITFCVIKCNYATEYMPVILIDEMKVLKADSVTNNPFNIVKSGDFIEIINTAIKNGDTLLIFIEDFFSSEDLTLKNLTGTPFKHLRKGLMENNLKYYAMVENPYKNLLKTLNQHKFNKLILDSTNYNWQDIVSLKYCYIYFKEQEGSRTDILKNHDELISNVYKMVANQTAKPVIAFYTGIRNIHKHNNTYQCYNKCPSTRRSGDVQDPGIYVKAPRSLRKTGALRTKFRRFPIVDREFTYNNKMSTVIHYADVALSFNFAYDQYKWTLESISWIMNDSAVGKTNLGIQAPWGRSYSCGDPIILRNKKNNDLLSIDEYQIQLLDDNDTSTRQGDDDFMFSEPEKCSSYITAGILSCILLSLLLIVVFWNATIFLMGVQGNDKFDDPKKPQFFGPTEG